MKIFTKANIKEAAKVKDGIEYIFEFVDCGKVFTNIQVNYNGRTFTKVESEFKDTKTGADLDTYYENDDLLVRNLDGSLELY